MEEIRYLIVLLATLTVVFGQKVAPGVPPQQYQQVPQYAPAGQPMHQQPMHQQPMHQQQMHQQPMHQQPMHQQPMHQQPMHQQPIQQQQPMHQQPIQQQQPIHHDPNMVPQQQQQHQVGGAPVHRNPQHVLDTSNLQGEKAHIQEHIDVPIDTSKMSEQELQFHYFKMHDSDHNNKLDGCELIKSLIHWHDKGNKDAHHGEAHHDKIFSDEELVALIDPILAMDDTGRDGYIDYPEFIKAQQKAASQQNAPKP